VHIYHKSRYQARKRYYEKEENKEKKRIYMRRYYERKRMENEVFGKREKEELEQSYRQSLANKKEREQKANEKLNVVNSERFINYDEKA
jgi:hypothetical protein